MVVFEELEVGKRYYVCRPGVSYVTKITKTEFSKEEMKSIVYHIPVFFIDGYGSTEVERPCDNEGWSYIAKESYEVDWKSKDDCPELLI